MSVLFFRRNRVGVVDSTTINVIVPDNDRAKLMYYLHCMCDVLSLEDIGYDLERLINFQQYKILSREEEKKLVTLCLLLSPDVMEGNCIFLNKEVCGIRNNRFFNICAARTTFACSETVCVGEFQVVVKQVMCFTPLWIIKNYFKPMENLINKISRQDDRCCCIL